MSSAQKPTKDPAMHGNLCYTMEFGERPNKPIVLLKNKGLDLKLYPNEQYRISLSFAATEYYPEVVTISKSLSIERIEKTIKDYVRQC